MITLNHVDFSYKRGQNLLDGLELELPQGHIYGLLGKNGVGKSTILKLLSGQLFPQSGEINAWGVTPQDRQPSFLSQVYYLAEDPYIPSMSMRSYVKFNALFYPTFDHLQLEYLMERLEVDPDQKFTTMSMGQAKRALIAFGVACNTKLLIMDEPTNGLDIPSKGLFRQIISSIATEERYIIISTHQVRDLETLIDSIIIVNDSQILLNSTIEEISERLLFCKVGEGDCPIYQENRAGGRWGIVENTTGDESGIDIELLFNAATSRPRKFNEIFNSK